ncbi:MAG: pyridoxamine 5'-phosphate oxidase family protein [Deltaproteobacteria bacterium]|nr:MAG: pyridoxamine 5'-phosphate oxidase family protein [Deltaproteobacteria bacterium]
MQLKEYLENASGVGVMSTADSGGKVDSAIYARPHLMDDGTIAFIMRDRLTHHNLQENPYAVYLFIEAERGYKGLRLFLKKEREDQDAELIGTLTRRSLTPEEDKAKGPKFLVYFKIEKALKLIGSDSPQIELP